MQHFVFGLHKKMPRIALWTEIRDREKIQILFKNCFKFHLGFLILLFFKYVRQIRLEDNGCFF